MAVGHTPTPPAPVPSALPQSSASNKSAKVVVLIADWTSSWVAVGILIHSISAVQSLASEPAAEVWMYLAQ